MENINSAQHEEIKAILENKNPNEFNIEKFIDEVKEVKDKYGKGVEECKQIKVRKMLEGTESPPAKK
jgi:predicted nucleic acid-binding OB-fold protein